jgi:hypothetical protein
MAQMINERGGPDGEFAQRMAEMIEAGKHGRTDDERRFLELADDLASLKAAVVGLKAADLSGNYGCQITPRAAASGGECPRT